MKLLKSQGAAHGPSRWAHVVMVMTNMGRNRRSRSALGSRGSAAVATALALALLMPTMTPSASALAGSGASYDFNTSASVQDGSGNGQAGTYHGTIWTASVPSGHTSPGAIGPTFSLDNYATIPDDALSPLPEGTVEAWVYPTSAQTNGYQILDFLRDGTGIHFAITVLEGKRYLQARVANAAINMQAPTEIVLDTWTHVAVSWSGTEVGFYINGRLDDLVPHIGSVSGTGTVYVGRISSDNTWSFSGYIDDLVITPSVKTCFPSFPCLGPSAPRNLTADTGTQTSPGVILRWDPPEEPPGTGAFGYAIYRGNESGEASLVGFTSGTTFYDRPELLRVAGTRVPDLTRPFYYVVAAALQRLGPVSNEACSAASPWVHRMNPIPAAPCPAPPGWSERTLFRYALQANQTPPFTPLLEVHGATRPDDAGVYELRFAVAGQTVPTLALLVGGLSPPPIDVVLPGHGPLPLPTAGYRVELVVTERHDPRQAACVSGLCVPSATPTNWWTQHEGLASVLVVHVRASSPSGVVLANSFVTLPYAGQALVAAP